MTKQIQVGNGFFAIVDDSDFDKVSRYKWRTLFNKNSNKTPYAVASGGLLMHRIILGLEKGDGKMVDHADHNTLNNTRNNLRVVTSQQNQMNRNKFSNNTTGYKGVTVEKWHKSKNYRADIRLSGKKIHIGYFYSAREAAIAYNEAAKKYHGEFAHLNDLGD